MKWTESTGDTGAWMRVFVAATPPAGVLSAIRRPLKQLQGAFSEGSVRWVDSDHTHLTVKFIGDIDPQRLEDLVKVLDQACQRAGPFELSVGGLGCFPEGENPRVLWVGLAGDLEALKRLQGEVDTACVVFGAKRENHEFQPHLTVGRVKRLEPEESGRLAGGLETEEWQSLGVWRVDEVQLIQSVLSPRGATYKVLETFPLGATSRAG